MHDGLAPLAIGTVWAITIAAALGAALTDDAALAAGIGLALASIIGSALFTLADQAANAIPTAMRTPIPNRGSRIATARPPHLANLIAMMD